MTKHTKIIIILLLALGPALAQAIAQYYTNFLAGLPLKVLVHIVVPIVAVMLIRHLSLKDSILLPITHEWKPDSKKFSIWMTLIGVAGSLAIIWTAYVVLGRYVDFPALVSDLRVKYNITAQTFILVALWITFVNSIFEEFFWRGFVFRGLNQFASKSWQTWGLITLTGFMFSIHHAVIVLAWFPPLLFVTVLVFLALAGSFFNWLYVKTGSIVPALIIHASADAIICFIGLILFGII